MKNIVKIFTVLFLTLNIMPVMAAGPYVDQQSIINTVQAPINDEILEQVNKIKQYHDLTAPLSVPTKYVNTNEIRPLLDNIKKGCNNLRPISIFHVKKHTAIEKTQGNNTIIECIAAVCEDGYKLAKSKHACEEDKKSQRQTVSKDKSSSDSSENNQTKEKRQPNKEANSSSDSTNKNEARKENKELVKEMESDIKQLTYTYDTKIKELNTKEQI